MAQGQPPASHPKNAMTGKGPLAQPPGNASGGQPGKTGVGPQNHNPKTGK